MTVTVTNEPQIDDVAAELQSARHHSLVIAETVGSSAGTPSWIPLFLLAILVVLAAILRIIATHNDLWLDELISLRIANAVETPWQIFTAVHNDNNHYLNTLYLYLVKNHQQGPVYRYLSVLWGVALVPAGYWLLARRSRLEAVILAGLLTCSYPLIHFSSEARGYSGALLGSVLACAALIRWLAPGNGKRRSFLLGLTYSTALAFAILSHLTACLIWFALAAGSFIVVARRANRIRSISLWIALNSLPAGVLALLYFFDFRFMRELGGNPMPVLHALARLLALAVGWSGKEAVTVWIVLVPLVILIFWHLADEEKKGEPFPIFLGFIYLTPLICVFALRTIFFSSRYFLVLLPFVYSSAAMLLARLARSRAGRAAAAALLLLFVAGETRLYLNFLQVGRGQFTAALEFMETQTPSSPLVVASNQDFRSGIELAYYWPRVAINRQLQYVPQGTSSPIKPEWYISHQEGYEPPGPAELHIAGQPVWYRVAYFGASELSGQAWTIYSHQPMR